MHPVLSLLFLFQKDNCILRTLFLLPTSLLLILRYWPSLLRTQNQQKWPLQNPFVRQTTYLLVLSLSSPFSMDRILQAMFILPSPPNHSDSTALKLSSILSVIKILILDALWINLERFSIVSKLQKYLLYFFADVFVCRSLFNQLSDFYLSSPFLTAHPSCTPDFPAMPQAQCTPVPLCGVSWQDFTLY